MAPDMRKRGQGPLPCAPGCHCLPQGSCATEFPADRALAGGRRANSEPTEHLVEVRRQQRTTEEPSLGRVAPLLAQEGGLARSLHPLRDEGHPQGMAPVSYT